MFPVERMEAAPAQVEHVLALAGCTQGAVLDLCCGPGRHSVGFARRGFQVTGVDRTQFLLDRASERAAAAGVNVEWVREDMRRFQRANAFDLVCSLFTSFGYFQQDSEELLVLQNVCQSLKPGGVLILEMLGKEWLAREWKDAISTDFPDGTLLLQRVRMNSEWSRILNQWYLLKEGRYRTFEFEHTVYSGRELKDRMLQAGFERVDLFGDLSGAPYGLNAKRLVAVARKAR